jgi:hypothetical protein
MEPGTGEAFFRRFTHYPVKCLFDPEVSSCSPWFAPSLIATQDQAMGDVHPFVAVAFDSLGTLERARGDFADAGRHEQRAAEIDEKLFGADNHQTARVKAHFAQEFLQEGKI